jgi:hypothetical protein
MNKSERNLYGFYLFAIQFFWRWKMGIKSTLEWLVLEQVFINGSKHGINNERPLLLCQFVQWKKLT